MTKVPEQGAPHWQEVGGSFPSSLGVLVVLTIIAVVIIIRVPQQPPTITAGGLGVPSIYQIHVYI